MVCKNCGNIVVKTERCCKICGEPFFPDEIDKLLENNIEEDEPTPAPVSVPLKKYYRSRWMLLFLFWIGGYFGLHCVWLGDSEGAWYRFRKSIKHILFCFIGIGIPFFIFDILSYIYNFFAIIFGKYKTDCNRNPIVWFKSGKPELE